MIQAEPVVVSGSVLTVDNPDALNEVSAAGVVAAIHVEPAPPPWLRALGHAVEDGRWNVDRVQLGPLTVAEFDEWLAAHLPSGVLDAAHEQSVRADLVNLADRLGLQTGARRFQVRLFTEAPTRRCGYHVDTVPNGAPTVGLLRVYNGPGTEFVGPENVHSSRAFYQYLGKRERLERELARSVRAADPAVTGRLSAELDRLDDAPSFLRTVGPPRVTPSTATVAFKHIDVALHWSDHPTSSAWIHRSPMSGPVRFVVNITSPDPRPRRPGP